LPNHVEPKILQKGLLIVIDGIDGAGKTTQTNFLVEKLQNEGYPVISLHEPTDGTYGQIIRQIAKGSRKASAEEELDFFLHDRHDDVTININPALKAGKIVVMDRYYFSSIAYQGARGLNLDNIEQKNLEIAPEPDLLIILDVKPTVSLMRIWRDRIEGPNEFENNERLEKAREIFNSFQNRSYTRIVDGNGQLSPENVSENIWNVVKPFITNFVDITFETEKLWGLLKQKLTISPIDKEDVAMIENRLTQLLCPKNKESCEPTECSFKLSNTCEFIKHRQEC